MSNPATQATPATVLSDDELNQMTLSLLAASESHKHDANVALWADTYGARLLCAAYAYHRLREAALQAIEAANIRHVYRGIEVRVIDWPPKSYDALRDALLPPSQHPACDPTDAGSGDVAAEAQT